MWRRWKENNPYEWYRKEIYRYTQTYLYSTHAQTGVCEHCKCVQSEWTKLYWFYSFCLFSFVFRFHSLSMFFSVSCVRYVYIFSYMNWNACANGCCKVSTKWKVNDANRQIFVCVFWHFSIEFSTKVDLWLIPQKLFNLRQLLVSWPVFFLWKKRLKNGLSSSLFYQIGFKRFNFIIEALKSFKWTNRLFWALQKSLAEIVL